MRKFAFYIIFVFVAISSCRKEIYPPSTEGIPIFKMSGTLDGQPFNLNAGQNGLYLNSSVVQNSFGVYELRSDFNQLGCVGCPPVMSILVNDNEVMEFGTPCTPDVLTEGSLPLAEQDNSSNYLSLNFNTPNQPGNIFSWNFGDGSQDTGHDPHHEFSAPGTYNVTLNISNGPGLNDDVIITQSVLVGAPTYLSAPFEIHNLQGDNWEFDYPNNLSPGLQITSWTINGVEYFGNNLNFNSDGQLNVCLNFYNSIANEAGSYCVAFDGDESGQVNGFLNYQWEAQDLNIGKLQMMYHKNGETYTSLTSLNQGIGAGLQILSVADYSERIDGRIAKKVQVEFSLWMVNISNPTDVIRFENVSAILGFAYE